MLIISNVKGSFKYVFSPSTQKAIKSLTSDYCMEIHHKSNFTVIKVLDFPSRLVFSIWWHSNHVNVTGVKSISSLQTAVQNFESYTGLKVLSNSMQIDNICANSKCVLHISLPQLCQAANRLPYFKAVLNRSYTPALYLKNCERGVCLIFRSGSVCFFGLNCFEKLEVFHNSICALMKTQ